MGNTTFYREADTGADRITWREILSECRKKHTRADLERALLAGSSMDSATEADMLRKWHKPWIFYPLLKGGAVLLAVLYGVYFVTLTVAGNITSAAYIMVVILPPLIIPVILMIFLWEMNIPRNISFYELLGFFLLGGLLSFTAVSLLFGIFPAPSGAGIQTQSQLNEYIFRFAFGAAAREEPAKLAAGIAILWWCSCKKKKIYGLTGLVVGAAVGAGFGGFESISYAMDSGMEEMIQNQITRAVLAVGGHVLYAAPYLAAVALEMRGGRFTGRCFTSKNFLLAFGGSFALHFAWDYLCFLGPIQYPGFAVIIALLWALLLYILRQCLQQAVRAGRSQGGGTFRRTGSGAAAVGTLTLQCISGPIRGAVWRLPPGHSAAAGRDPSCPICFPQGTRGISRQHCVFRYGAKGWTVTDLNSTYGTWMGDGRRLAPGVEQPLHPGDRIYLADKQNALQVN